MINKHRQHLLAWVLIMAMPLWLANCKKGGNDPITPSTSSIEGTWNISGQTISPGVDLLGNGQKVTDLLAFLRALPNGAGSVDITCITTSKISFNSNAKVVMTMGQKCDQGMYDPSLIDDGSTWKLDGNKLTIIDKKETVVFDVNRSGNTMSLSVSQQEDLGEGVKTYTITMLLTR